MAFNMNSSPAKFMWPWSKKARRKREEKRNIKEFREKTEVRDGKTYDRKKEEDDV